MGCGSNDAIFRDSLKEEIQNVVPHSSKLQKIYLEPTTTCNLSCQTCMRNTWTEQVGHMAMDTFAQVIKSIHTTDSIETVALWGIGESLTHPRIDEMVQVIHQTGIQTEMITNGMLLNNRMAEKLINAGLDRLIVSLDSTSEDQFSEIRNGANLHKILENIRTLNKLKYSLRKRNPEIGIEFTVMKRNISELKYLRELSSSIDARFIMVTNVLPYTKQFKDEILYWLSAVEYKPSKRSSWNPEIVLPKIDMRSEYIPDIGKISFESLSFGSNEKMKNLPDRQCPFIERGATAINWKGDVSPCVPLMHTYTCYVLGREKKFIQHYVGNINEKNLSEIWHQASYQQFREKVQKFDFPPCVSCHGCELTHTNEEDCFQNMHPTCGDCLWAHGIIQCP